MHPLPTPARSLPVVEMTKRRLWFFTSVTCVLPGPNTWIQRLTGWPQVRVNYRIRSWRLTMPDPAYIHTKNLYLERIADALGVYVDSALRQRLGVRPLGALDGLEVVRLDEISSETGRFVRSTQHTFNELRADVVATAICGARHYLKFIEDKRDEFSRRVLQSVFFDRKDAALRNPLTSELRRLADDVSMSVEKCDDGRIAGLKKLMDVLGEAQTWVPVDATELLLESWSDGTNEGRDKDG